MRADASSTSTIQAGDNGVSGPSSNMSLPSLRLGTELEADALALVRDFPAERQPGVELEVVAALDQRIEDVAADAAPIEREGIDRIPARAVGGVGDGDGAAGERRRRDEQ